MSERGQNTRFGVTDWVKRNTLQWLGHIERKYDDRMVKEIYKSEVEVNCEKIAGILGREVREYTGKRTQEIVNAREYV